MRKSTTTELFQSKACAIEQRARCKRPIANRTRLATLDSGSRRARQPREHPTSARCAKSDTGSHCRILFIASAIAA